MATIEQLQQKVQELQTDRKKRWELTCVSIQQALEAADRRGDDRARARIQEMTNKADEHVSVLLSDPSVGLPRYED